MEALGWVKVNNGAGSGYGDGAGYGAGSGYGDGAGYGAGAGSGNGNGYGDGNGDGAGAGYGAGTGYGAGYGAGAGSGNGNGSGYKYKKAMVYNIDGTATIIKSIKGNVANGYIVNKDLSLESTYVVKDEDSKYFAHGKTIKDAMQSLQDKIIADMDTEELIDMFLEEVDVKKVYKASYFFAWHGKLTGSCLQGRESFVHNKGIDLQSDMTLNEFLQLTKDEYGGEVINQITERCSYE